MFSKLTALRAFILVGTILALASCGQAEQSNTQPSGQGVDNRFGALPKFFNCAAETGPIISAHRGGPARGLAENSIPTLGATLANGVFLLEIDVRTSSDGELVLMHDERLERTTSGKGFVRDTSLPRLKSLSLKDAEGRKGAWFCSHSFRSA